MRVTSNGRVHRSESEWRDLLGRFEASGLSARAFCRREGLNMTSFQRWQQRLSGEPGRFVELTPVSATALTGTAWEVEVRLPNGAQLTFRG